MNNGKDARAWDAIEEVEKLDGWCDCAHCGAPLFDVKDVALDGGRVRVACSRCMQRYNYKAIPAYPTFGSFG